MVEQAALKDLLLVTKDGEWGRSEPDDGFVEMSIIRGTDFSKVRFGDLETVPKRYIPAKIADRKRLQSGDILIETAGGSKDRPTGRTVLLKDRLFNTSDRPITCASFSRFLRVNPELAHSEFVYWFLQFLYSSGQMEEHQVQHTGVARFQYTKFAEATLIPLPPLSEQRAIAHILGTLDDKIELNRRTNETLEAMARAIFKSWFVDFDPVRAKADGRDPGLPKYIADLFPDRFEGSDLGAIPAGWKTSMLGEIAENPRRTIRPAQMEESTTYIGLEHMPRQSISLADWDCSESLESNKYEFKRGEILFGKLRPYFHKVGIAPVDGVCSTDILVVAAKQPEWYGFLLEHVSSEDFVNYTTATSSGTKMPRTNWKDMSGFGVATPPASLAQAFNVLVQPFLKRIVENIHESRTLAAIRDALLPRLISGELRVKGAERLLEETME